MNVSSDENFIQNLFSKEIINNGKNAVSKIKCRKLVNNIKSPNSGLITVYKAVM